MREDEIKIIDQAKQGCQKAFEQIYKQHKPLVEMTVRMYIKNTMDIDELVNTTFIKVFKKLNKFVIHDSFEKWVKTIAINSCIDFLRSKKNRDCMLSVDDNISYIQLSDEYSTENTYINNETNSKLDEMCNRVLSNKQQNLVDLYYNQGFLYKEIAKMLKMPLGSVKSELHRAKIKLKQLLPTPINN